LKSGWNISALAPWISKRTSFLWWMLRINCHTCRLRFDPWAASSI
jgi:hypothetical protein